MLANGDGGTAKGVIPTAQKTSAIALLLASRSAPKVASLMGPLSVATRLVPMELRSGKGAERGELGKHENP